MKRTNIRIAVFVLSVFFIGIGIAKQEHLDVMQKAVMVCLECIGIG